MINILTICGSLRANSLNAIVADALAPLAPENVRVSRAPSFQDFPIYNADVHGRAGITEAVTKFIEAIAAADGVVIVSPEYNYSIPGGLKNALDWVSRSQPQPLAGKPVAIQSASPGPVGGARMQYHLRQTLVFLDSRVLNKPEVIINNAGSRIDPAVRAVSDEATRTLLAQQLATFRDFIRADPAQ